MTTRRIKELKSISSAADWFRVHGRRDNYRVDRVVAFALAVVEELDIENRPHSLGEMTVPITSDCVGSIGNQFEDYVPDDYDFCLHLSDLEWSQEKQAFDIRRDVLDRLIWAEDFE